ncbi:hypothetical protein LTR36_008281 [Oleoguttula mirabilis]|uniref:Uncharacterized protein n=1 Tax=Oleoguttula mirabilis TaxID=1507867 RepID=A0AAV9J7M2_9PEZI|nr:hypothetical protein LTR36_008281 [Oleoguttula mirabilis]
MSHPADKLPAFAGLAEAFARARDDVYLAGLWKRRLVHDLMWEARTNRETRRHAWRAPSWSWASIDAGIDVVGAHKRILPCQLDGCQLMKQTETAQIVDCGVELEDECNKYGAVRSAFVVLCAPLVEMNMVSGTLCVTLRIDGLQLAGITPAAIKVLRPGHFATASPDLALYMSADLQGFGNTEDGYDVVCMQVRQEIVQSKTLGEVTLMDGLILMPVDPTGGVFRRVGVWVTEFAFVVSAEQNPFHGVEPSTVKIV